MLIKDNGFGGLDPSSVERVSSSFSSLEFCRACRPLDEMLVLFKVTLVFSFLLVGMGTSTF